MAVIRVLDRHVAELIAAGEVVERPSSVIKELVENSIDAGAKAITVEVQRGGVTYLRIADDGCGIAREDVPTAFLRHATSKVRTEDDLAGIGTLGFRGEALASVAAVARVDMLTKTAAEELGTRYRIEGGDEVDCDDAGCPDGTTIIVRDLFYNTPARMKFLKKDVAEANAAADVVDRIALTHPEISFRFVRDGKETLHTPGDGRLYSAIYAVYGKEFASTLIPAEYSHAGIRMDGFISKPTAARANRNMQHFIVNGRFVRTKTAMAALSEGYKNSIMAGKFPACVLRFELPSDQVDVNVHPAKIEVRFVQEKPIFDTVYFGVKTALAQRDSRPVMDLPRKKFVPPAPPAAQPISLFEDRAKDAADRKPLAGEMGSVSTVASVRKETQRAAVLDPSAEKIASTAGSQKSLPTNAVDSIEDTAPSHVLPPLPAVDSSQSNWDEDASFADQTPSCYDRAVEVRCPAAVTESKRTEDGSALSEAAFAVPAPVQREPQLQEAPSVQNTPPESEIAPEISLRLLGEAFATYAIVEAGQELLLIDKHAAHERILFDRLMDNRAQPQSQMLLQPVAVTLSKEEYSALLEHMETVLKAGFDISDFGSGTILVRAVPLEVQGGDVPLLMQEIAGKFMEHRQEVSLDHLEWIYHSVACRAAVKAGDASGAEELLALARRICADHSVMYCPHGRPVAIRLTKREVERQFGRIQ